MLTLAQIDLSLGAFRFRGLDLALAGAEYFVLMGPSGVGKTVMLETIAGLHRPSRGEVLWDGAPVTHLPPEARGFAMAYQDHALFDHLSVCENIGYGLRFRPVDKPAAQEKITTLAERLGVAPLLDRSVRHLSGGEKQRVSLARALAVEPRLLLLDEPLSALDTPSRVELRRTLAEIHREYPIPLLHVTHDATEALALGDRIGVMIDQEIRQVGTPEEVTRDPVDDAVAAFFDR